MIRRLSGQLVRDPFSSAADSEASHADWEAMQAVEYGARTGAGLDSHGEQEAGGTRDALYAEMTYAVAQRHPPQPRRPARGRRVDGPFPRSQARVVVTDVTTGAMGSVLHTFEATSAVPSNP